jgi:molybdopterin converting factor small subunit
MPDVTLLYFAQIGELLQRERETCTLPSPTSDSGILAAIAARHPAVAALLPSCRVAVDCEFRSGPLQLIGGEEVAVIPPVSGG